MSASTSPILSIGTRGSPLALVQAHMTQAALLVHWSTAIGRDSAAIGINIIRTSGDRIQDRALSEAGGKGLFTKEIDEAQLAGHIDIAVHSAKDLPTALPEGLIIAGYLAREDVRDALICSPGQTIATLPHHGRIGSASLRRRAQLLRQRPDLKPELLRGNVSTRIAKVRSGEVDATLLALAGLKRLGLAHEADVILGMDAFLPAVGQGAIALLTRKNDSRAQAAIASFACASTAVTLEAERAFLAVLDGSCRTPIAGHAWLAEGLLHIRGEVLAPDGSAFVMGARKGAAQDAARMGHDLGRELKRTAPPGALSQTIT